MSSMITKNVLSPQMPKNRNVGICQDLSLSEISAKISEKKPTSFHFMQSQLKAKLFVEYFVYLLHQIAIYQPFSQTRLRYFTE